MRKDLEAEIHKEKPVKKAAGGAAKVRKGVATPAGKPIAQPKKKGK